MSVRFHQIAFDDVVRTELFFDGAEFRFVSWVSQSIAGGLVQFFFFAPYLLPTHVQVAIQQNANGDLVNKAQFQRSFETRKLYSSFVSRELVDTFMPEQNGALFLLYRPSSSCERELILICNFLLAHHVFLI